jgi:hypothetical protein
MRYTPPAAIVNRNCRGPRTKRNNTHEDIHLALDRRSCAMLIAMQSALTIQRCVITLAKQACENAGCFVQR